MGELKDQADEYLRGEHRQGHELRFASFRFRGNSIFALAQDGTLWEAAWSDAGVEGWRPVSMERYEEEYVDS